MEKKKRRGRRKKGRKKEAPPVICTDCDGSGLSDLARSVYVDEKNIEDVLRWSVAEAGRKLGKLRVPERSRAIVEPTIAEATRRLEFLDRVGLGYLQLDRAATTLSGGRVATG